MSEKRKRNLIAIGAIFIVYSIVAVRPVSLETVLVPRWLSSMESGPPISFGEQTPPPGAVSDVLPFTMDRRFGYVGMDGQFLLNRERTGQVSISGERWAEFDAEPESLTLYGIDGEALLVIENSGGYPFFLDGRVFVIGSGQDSVSEIGGRGEVLWTFDFPSPVTSMDAAAGLLLAGLLDGVAVLVDGMGRQVFSFDPGGSRFSVILGTAISADGSQLVIISGIDSQRFLFLERFGAGPGDYRVVYHEFLGEGFRRPVHVAFIENGRHVVFERHGGLGIFDTASRLTRNVEVDGRLRALDGSGGQGLLFAVFADSESGAATDGNNLIGIRVSARTPRVVIRAPFRSEEVFL